MNEKDQMTTEGKKMYDESARQIQAVKDFPGRVIRKVVKKVKGLFNRYAK